MCSSSQRTDCVVKGQDRVSQWRTTGVPVRFWRLMSEWTQGQVSVDEMLALVESKHPTKEAA